jgi:Rrf2 family iron-sulfur cluster assembly transcriptional regulator
VNRHSRLRENDGEKMSFHHVRRSRSTENIVDRIGQLKYHRLMLKVSTKSTYAVRALLQLALERAETPIRLAGLAKKQAIPLPFLEQIFSKLRRAGVVASVRGPQGGYKLARTPDNISLADIIVALEGPLEPVLCTLPQNRTPDCHEVEGCYSRHVCKELDGELNRVLSKNTLGAMLGQMMSSPKFSIGDPKHLRVDSR